MGTPSQSYGTSLAIWDHTVLPATRHKWTYVPLCSILVHIYNHWIPWQHSAVRLNLTTELHTVFKNNHQCARRRWRAFTERSRLGCEIASWVLTTQSVISFSEHRTDHDDRMIAALSPSWMPPSVAQDKTASGCHNSPVAISAIIINRGFGRSRVFPSSSNCHRSQLRLDWDERERWGQWKWVKTVNGLLAGEAGRLVAGTTAAGRLVCVCCWQITSDSVNVERRAKPGGSVVSGLSRDWPLSIVPSCPIVCHSKTYCSHTIVSTRQNVRLRWAALNNNISSIFWATSNRYRCLRRSSNFDQ